MSVEFKNILRYSPKPGGPNRRSELLKHSTDDSGYQISTLSLEDYDRAFKKWVEEKLFINYDGEPVSTVALFASQRFGEYMQTWENTDDKKNIQMNFKVLTRENNPKSGTMYGEIRNIPEDKYYLIQRIETVDQNGRPVYLDYKMRQPYCIDIEYHVSIVTNKFRMLNEFNEIVNHEFRAIDSYLDVNGNFVSMTLDGISDESEYQIDDRQYYSQIYDITVRGYIVREEDLIVEESPKIKYGCIEKGIQGGSLKKAELEYIDPCKVEETEYQGVMITIELGDCVRKHSVVIDEAFVIKSIEVENSKSFEIRKNGQKIFEYERISQPGEVDLRFLPGETLSIEKNVIAYALKNKTTIKLIGYNPYEVIKKEYK